MKKELSKSLPEIRRLQGLIVYPVGIEQIQVENGKGIIETFYRYYPVKLQDKGDDITASDFSRKRYADLRRLSPMPYGYGSQNKQLELQQELGFDAWVSHCGNVKANFPKQ